MSKNMVEPEGPQMTSQYGVYELHSGKARLHARTLMHTPTPSAHALIRVRARTQIHTHTRICNIYYFTTSKMIRERSLDLRYTYIVLYCLLFLLFFFLIRDKNTFLITVFSDLFYFTSSWNRSKPRCSLFPSEFDLLATKLTLPSCSHLSFYATLIFTGSHTKRAGAREIQNS
jgi:hypothetical protein